MTRRPRRTSPFWAPESAQQNPASTEDDTSTSFVGDDTPDSSTGDRTPAASTEGDTLLSSTEDGTPAASTGGGTLGATPEQSDFASNEPENPESADGNTYIGINGDNIDIQGRGNTVAGGPGDLIQNLTIRGDGNFIGYSSGGRIDTRFVHTHFGPDPRDRVPPNLGANFANDWSASGTNYIFMGAQSEERRRAARQWALRRLAAFRVGQFHYGQPESSSSSNGGERDEVGDGDDGDVRMSGTGR